MATRGACLKRVILKMDQNGPKIVHECVNERSMEVTPALPRLGACQHHHGECRRTGSHPDDASSLVRKAKRTFFWTFGHFWRHISAPGRRSRAPLRFSSGTTTEHIILHDAVAVVRWTTHFRRSASLHGRLRYALDASKLSISARPPGARVPSPEKTAEMEHTIIFRSNTWRGFRTKRALCLSRGRHGSVRVSHGYTWLAETILRP